VPPIVEKAQSQANRSPLLCSTFSNTPSAKKWRNNW